MKSADEAPDDCGAGEGLQARILGVSALLGRVNALPRKIRWLRRAQLASYSCVWVHCTANHPRAASSLLATLIKHKHARALSQVTIMALSSKMGLMALLVVAAVASASAAHGGPYPYKYYAYMKGKFEVPPLVTKTWGFGYVEWNATDILVSVELHNADGITAVHVHNGTMGENGPVVLPVASFMMPGSNMPQPVSGDFDTYVMLKTADYPWLPEFLSMGMGYFNAHSVANPDGEVRGQLYVAKMPEEMMPPPMQGDETIASVAMEYPELSTFVAAVSAAPAIMQAASDPMIAVTVLAPTNEAFDNAVAALNVSLGDLVANTELLTQILGYHVLTSVIPAADVPTSPVNVSTLLGPTVSAVSTDGVVMFNDMATVVTANIMVNGGMSIIHEIDSVLLPPGLEL
eukprot:364300-Chlamydomonas_euryale.AAC.6